MYYHNLKKFFVSVFFKGEALKIIKDYTIFYQSLEMVTT